MTELSRQPVADRAEHNAFFPSEYSLSQYTAPKTNFAGTKFAQPYTGDSPLAGNALGILAADELLKAVGVA